MTNLKSQISIFDTIYPKFIIDKPIRLIELFAGYGSQALALKYLGVPFEHYKICEWAIKSIQAYKDIHFNDDNIDYSKNYTKQELINYLYELGISANYNEPMTLEQINRLNEKQIRQIYNNIKATHNLVNIQQVKANDLKICDLDKYTYILTYSFPCQDLSLAGKGKGMSDTSTRSGMLWEVERILDECNQLGTLPQILLMENVPQVHGSNNVEDFNKWQLKLESLGYKNYWEDLIATDYEIPQTRNRCFMVSILGDYSFTFPPKKELKLKLKDMLEDNVDEKFYLSDKQIESLENGSYNASKPSVKLEITDKGLCQTLDTMTGGNRQPLVRTGNKSLQETLEKNEINDTCYIDTYNKRIDKEKSGTITTGVSFRNNTFLAIKNANSKGYLEAEDGDGIELLQPNSETRRGRVQKQTIQTLDTMGDNGKGVVIGTYQYAKSDKFMHGKNRFQPGKETSDTIQTSQKEAVVIGNYSPSNHEASRIVDSNYSAPTIKENHGTITATKTNELRIRKLTPKECFRLMGVKDEDYEKCAKNQSNASLYHLAGDSIVVNVIQAIIKELI